MHPFERAQLGTAPFRCVGVEQKWHEMPGFGRKPGGTCNYCGTGILDCFQIVSSEGRRFVVGSSCVERTDAAVEDFKIVRLAHARAKRQAGAAVRRESAKAAREAAQAERLAARVVAGEVWRTEHRPLVDRLYALRSQCSFAGKMVESLEQWGALTDAQAAAVSTSMDRYESDLEAAQASRHVGVEGQRLKKQQVRITFVKRLEDNTTFYPPQPRYLVKLVTSDRAQLVWFTSTGHGLEPSDTFVEASFTVKSLGSYQGAEQTTVSRVTFK